MGNSYNFVFFQQFSSHQRKLACPARGREFCDFESPARKAAVCLTFMVEPAHLCGVARVSGAPAYGSARLNSSTTQVRRSTSSSATRCSVVRHPHDGAMLRALPLCSMRGSMPRAITERLSRRLLRSRPADWVQHATRICDFGPELF